MKLDEFERRFDTLWTEKYALYDPATDHWTGERVDARARQECRNSLLEYASEVQRVGIARKVKNKPQRLFDELGIDPATLELIATNAEPPARAHPATQKSRVMYIERKAGHLAGEARIGRVTFSRSGRTLCYGGRSFRSLNGAGFKSNYYCVETGEEYWISGCKSDGSDRLYGERVPVWIDDDVRDEYWIRIRNDERRKGSNVA
jgi:hypothetical protein